jgi:hypothetical protein
MSSLRRAACHLVWVVSIAFALSLAAKAEDWPPITPEERSMTSLPEQPGAAAVVLLRDELADDPHNDQTYYRRIKVLTEAGREYANVEIPYSRRDFTIYGVSGRTIHSDGTVIPFTGKAFDKLLVKTAERGKKIQYRVKSFTLPDVQVGSILEYRYHLSFDDHSFYAAQWDVQDELFQKKATFKFIPYSGLLRLAHDRVGQGVAWTSYLPNGAKPADHTLPRSSIATSRTASEWIDLELSNIPPIVHEPFMAPVEVLRYRVQFYYLEGAQQEEFWKTEGKFWSKDVENFIGRRNGVSEAVSQTVSPADTAEQKAQKIYTYVTKLSNWSYEPSRTEQEEKALGIKLDRGAEDVLKQKGGSHDDLNELYAAMLRAAGIPASMMWVPSRDHNFFDPIFLSTRQLEAEIVIAQIDGKEVYLDPGSKFCPYGLLDWRYSNVRGIRQREGKATEIVQSKLADYNHAMIQRMARLQMKSDGTAEGSLKVGFYGLEAMERRREAGKTDVEGRKKMLEDEVKTWLPGNSDATLTNSPNWDETEGHLVTEFKISTPMAVGAGKRWIIPVHLFQVNEKPRFSASARVNQIYFEYLSREIDEVHVKVPDELEIESLPPNESARLDYALYTTTQKKEQGNSVMGMRDLTMGGMLFPTTMYKEIKDFFDKVKAGDDQPVVAKAAVHAELR